jgi:Ca2+/H+ antiporter
LGHSSVWPVLTSLSFIWYNARSQHSIFDEVLEADEHADLDRRADLAKPKFTFTECIVALALSLAVVTLLAVFLVERIEDVVEAGIPDQFLGLIMLPLVEKAAEHLTAIDEAWDGQIVCFGHILLMSLTRCRTSRFFTAWVRPFKLHCSMLLLLSSLAGLWARTWISTSRFS